MKVCLVHNLWGKVARGGAESTLVLIADHLKNQGHEVVIITTDSFNSHFSNDAGITVYSIKSQYLRLSTWPTWRKLLWHLVHSFDVYVYFKLKKIIKSEKPDLIWTHNLVGFGFLIFCLIKKLKLRHFHSIHDLQLLHPSGLLLRHQEKIIDTFFAHAYQAMIIASFPVTTKVISPSSWILDIYKAHGFFKNNKCLVAANPVKSIIENISEQSENKLSGNFTFLYVGQIEAHKGIKILIEAFKNIQNKNIGLMCVGEGSYLEYVQADNQDSRVEFKGKQSSLFVHQLMQSADCLIVPSLCYENLPTVILEARAVGLPVIGSNFAGIKEMLRAEELLFEPKVEELEKKLKWVLDHQIEVKNIFVANSTLTNTISVKDYCQKLTI